MHEDLVTIGTFSEPSQAELAQQRLEEGGISTYLKGAAPTGKDTGLEGSFSTIKLQVRQDDLERARELLAAPVPPAEAEEPDEREEDDAEEPYDPESTEALAVRAWRAALIGLLPPLWVFLHFYSLWLLAKLSSRPDEVSPGGMWRVYGALAIDGFVLVGVALIVRSVFL